MVTRGHSCVLCQQRKVRCELQKPCSNCVKALVECKMAPSLPPRRRRAMKLQGHELIERLQRYEALMSRHGIDFEHARRNDGGSAAPQDDIRSPKSITPHVGLSSNGDERGRESQRSIAYSQEYRSVENIMRQSSRYESDHPTFYQAFDVMFNNTDGFPLGIDSMATSVTNAHPLGVKIFQLWQIYISNIDPLIKVIHVPSFQAQIVLASSDPTKIPKSLEALMFSIYFISVASLVDEEAQSMFGETKAVLLSRYRRSAEQALVNTDFMRSNELMVLQAYLLYLFGVGSFTDPRSLFCLTGIAVRIATRMGLHQDGSQSDLSLFQTEQRRRLWWQINVLDKRIAEMTGSATTALFPGSDCSLPLNVNDADMHQHAKAPPAVCIGSTDMVFSLTRIALTVGLAPRGTQFSSDSWISSSRRPHDLDGLCAHIESLYLQHCDRTIPVHLFTLLLARLSLCRLRVIDFISRGSPVDDDLNGTEREQLFLAAVQMLEYTTEICTDKSLSGFKWYMYMHAPMPGRLFLASELQRRTTGELCERAWNALAGYYNILGIERNIQTPVHSAISKMLLLGWDGHAEAERQEGRVVQTPEMITLLRQRFCKSTDYPRTDKTPAVGISSTEATQRQCRQSRESVGRISETLTEELQDDIWTNLPGHKEIDWPHLLQYNMFEGFDSSTWLGFSNEHDGSL